MSLSPFAAPVCRTVLTLSAACCLIGALASCSGSEKSATTGPTSSTTQSATSGTGDAATTSTPSASAGDNPTTAPQAPLPSVSKPAGKPGEPKPSVAAAQRTFARIDACDNTRLLNAMKPLVEGFKLDKDQSLMTAGNGACTWVKGTEMLTLSLTRQARALPVQEIKDRQGADPETLALIDNEQVTKAGGVAFTSGKPEGDKATGLTINLPQGESAQEGLIQYISATPGLPIAAMSKTLWELTDPA